MNLVFVASQIALGLIALVIGGEFLVRGASSIAALMRIPSIIIGLTVVSFGTSAPELVVSLQAALANASDVAVGNVVGSNIFNVLFVLGVSAVICPLVVKSQLVRLDVPLMIFISLFTWFLAADGRINRFDGCMLFACLLIYITICIFNARKNPARRETKSDVPPPPLVGSLSFRTLVLPIALILGGLACLSFGAKWLVVGAVSIATWFGVSELVIGLTVVAIGTSLPEVVTSVVATIRGERDIAVGNVVGSNIFNLGCVLGLASAVAPGGLAVEGEATTFDIPMMCAVAIVCLPIFFTGQVIARWEGILFLGYYVAYTTLTILAQTHPTLADQMGWILGTVVAPLTVLTLVISFVVSLNTDRANRTAV